MICWQRQWHCREYKKVENNNIQEPVQARAKNYFHHKVQQSFSLSLFFKQTNEKKFAPRLFLDESWLLGSLEAEDGTSIKSCLSTKYALL